MTTSFKTHTKAAIAALDADIAKIARRVAGLTARVAELTAKSAKLTEARDGLALMLTGKPAAPKAKKAAAKPAEKTTDRKCCLLYTSPSPRD